MSKRDYYEVLDVPRDADDNAIKGAYRRLARQYHPDVNKAADAEERFKEINEAYEVLSDADRRAAYDRYGHAGTQGFPGGAGGFGGAGFPGFNDIFEEFFGLAGVKTRYWSTLATLVLPAIFVLITLRDAQGNPVPAWKVIWPAFGASNQLLAALTLLVITLWLKKGGKRTGIVLVPMAFMIVMTVWALVLLIGRYRLSVIGLIAAVLLLMALLLVRETARALRA